MPQQSFLVRSFFRLLLNAIRILVASGASYVRKFFNDWLMLGFSSSMLGRYAPGDVGGGARVPSQFSPSSARYVARTASTFFFPSRPVRVRSVVTTVHVPRAPFVWPDCTTDE